MWDWLIRWIAARGREQQWPTVIIDPDLDARARNSVSRGEIRMNPKAPYGPAVFAQELFEYREKLLTGREISTLDECMSWECQVQTVRRLYPAVNLWKYRAAQAHLMLWWPGYDFAEEGWSQRQIFQQMRAFSERAEQWVDDPEHWRRILAYEAQLQAWNAAESDPSLTGYVGLEGDG